MSNRELLAGTNNNNDSKNPIQCISFSSVWLNRISILKTQILFEEKKTKKR